MPVPAIGMTGTHAGGSLQYMEIEEIQKIRDCYYNRHMKIQEIADLMKHDVKTIRKYLDQVDFNQPVKPSAEVNLCPKLDPYKETIDGWLEDDKRMPRKQRHTARRVYNRLRDETKGFNCSYRTVCTYFSFRRRELDMDTGDAQMPLNHGPGEAQGDFGDAVFNEGGQETKGHYFVLSFPYSNAGYLQLTYGLNEECLLESMDAIFRYIGGVPTEIWLDNASTMVSIIRTGKKVNDRFGRFALHYGFQFKFMNRAKGNEKGNVENKVGTHRRNLLVPEPQFDSMKDYNKVLLHKCDECLQEKHYLKGTRMDKLFEEDKAVLHPLPDIPFDLAGYRTYKVSNTGLFTVDSKYTYSASPAYRSCNITVKMTSDTVTVLDRSFHPVVVHPRLYGDNPAQHIDWLPYLKYIAQKPRSFTNTGIAEMMPDDLRVFLMTCPLRERGTILTIIARVTEEKGFGEAVKMASAALHGTSSPADSLEVMYRTGYEAIPAPEDLQTGDEIPEVEKKEADLDEYDALIRKGGHK